MIYLSSTTSVPDRYKWKEFGVMFSAKHPIGGLSDALAAGAWWMMDNNAFTSGFDASVWLKSLIKYQDHAQTCAGIPVPDVVGDALGTLRLFSQYHRVVADLGYPVAFVTQDGITPELAPWDTFETLFVGGTNDHKLGPEAGAMIAEAKARGKRIHVGRVNSLKRLRQFWMCDTVDGTHFTRQRRRTTESDADQAQKLADKYADFAATIRWCNHRKSGVVGVANQYQMVMQ